MIENEEVSLTEDESVSNSEVTANSESESITPEVNEDQSAIEERKFTQAEIDNMISKRLAREQRKWEREQQAKLSELEAKARVTGEVPSIDQFETVEAYAEALAERRAIEKLAQQDAARHHAELMDAYREREEQVREKYDDFEEVAYNENLPVTDFMAETIRASEIGPELAYYLGSNPKEAARIARLTPLSQAKEIGKIEAKLVDNPPVKKSSSMPPPITPVSSRVSNPGALDTTDPRSTKTLSTSEWIEAERRRQVAKLQAQRNR